MRKIFSTLLVSSAFFVPIQGAAAKVLFPDLDAAKQAYQAERYDEAFENWLALAEFGMPKAMMEVGVLYRKGLGTETDYVAAADWLQKSADAGLPRASYELGSLYEDGLGVQQDLHRAETLYRQAAGAGYASAYNALGKLYQKNPEFAPNPTPVPIENYDVLLEKVKSGELAHAEKLGYAHEHGLGVPIDQERSLMYYTIAARAGSDTAAASAKGIKLKMSQESIATAEQMAEDFIVYVRVPEFYEVVTKGQTKPKRDKARERTRKTFFKDLKKQTGGPTAQDVADQERYGLAMAEYQKALEGGYLNAANNIGQMYQKGYGVSADPVKALAYYLVAAKRGSASAKTRAHEIRQTMTDQQVAEANILADELYARYAEVKHKPERKPYRVRGNVRTQYIAEENPDLGTRSADFENSFALDSRVGLYLYPTDDITTFVEGRAITTQGGASTDDDEGSTVTDGSFAELRQFWVEFDNLFGNPRFSTKIGRQRIREERNIWWNRDFDALSFALDSTLTSGFIAVGQNMDSYRVGDDDEFEQEEQDRFRVFGELSRRLTLNHNLDARFFYENDYSGAENVGSIFSNDDRDDEDAELLWLGLRAHGAFPQGENGLLNTVSYRLDGMMVTGEETLVDTTASGTTNRLVTGTRDRDVMGYGFDGAVTADFGGFLSPSLTLGYAYGSGEDNPNGTDEDGAFRQTGLHGNTSRYPDRERTGETLRNYGEVLRPELSNLHIGNVGVNVPIFGASDLNLNYFAYYLDEEATRLRSSGISAAMNGQDKFVGQAFDIGINIDWGEEFGIETPYTDRISSRFRLGSFFAGDAYGAAEDEAAYRGSVEFKVTF